MHACRAAGYDQLARAGRGGGGRWVLWEAVLAL